jgi:hypothetical protein
MLIYNQTQFKLNQFNVKNSKKYIILFFKK